jgi:hypothetical protein
VFARFNPTGGNSGVLEVIEGDYLADVPVHGTR